jgi:trans-aconitate methyltransferase
MPAVDPDVQANIEGYAKRARSYEAIHIDIFNSYEQARLAAALGRAVHAIQSGGTNALDFGCGTGNLTHHMRSRGLVVTCADVSPQFLRIVAERYKAPTIELPGGSTDAVPDNAFDLVALYSVLHHIPDYLASVERLVNKLKRGGVLFVDHECNRDHWYRSPELQQFRQEMRAAQMQRPWCPEHKRWQRPLTLSFYRRRYHRLRNINVEGDIHVHAYDHVDWDAVIKVAVGAGCELVERMNYLMFRGGRFDEAVWQKWDGHATDMGGVIFRRI